MTKTSLAIMVIVCLCTGMVSCHRTGDFIPVRQDLKDAFLFREGSYWIYRDTMRGTLDSVYVRRVDSAYSIEGDNEDQVEYFEMKMAACRWNGTSFSDCRDGALNADLETTRIKQHNYPFTTTVGMTVTPISAIVIQGNTFQNVTQIVDSYTYIVKERLGLLYVRYGGHSYCLERWYIIQ